MCFQVSPNNKLVAYAEDTKGNEIYTIYVIDAESGTPVGKPIVGALTSYLEWAGDDALMYVTMDAILRPDKVHTYPVDIVYKQYFHICALALIFYAISFFLLHLHRKHVYPN